MNSAPETTVRSDMKALANKPGASGLKALLGRAATRTPRKPVQFTVKRTGLLGEATVESLCLLVAHVRQVTPGANLETVLALLIDQLAPKGLPVPEGTSPADLEQIKAEYFFAKSA